MGVKADAADGRGTSHMSLFSEGERHESGGHGPQTEELLVPVVKHGKARNEESALGARVPV